MKTTGASPGQSRSRHPNTGVVRICPRGRAGAAGGAAAAAAAAAKAAPAETAAATAATAAASLLGVGLKRQAQTEPEDNGKVLTPICRLFDHICLAVWFSQIAVDSEHADLKAAGSAASR